MASLILSSAAQPLTANDLGVGSNSAIVRASTLPDAPPVDEHDPVVVHILSLLSRYSGVLLSGPPGTSKSYQAKAAALVAVGQDNARVAFTQFHPSYQYADFMEGYSPQEGGGFRRHLGVFLKLCQDAAKEPNKTFVIVIDELSRGDAARIFGEALTYVERSRRGAKFQLPSGAEVSVPPNVGIIATMNPLDRGVDEVDAAFERRFAKVNMLPSADALRGRLEENGLDDLLVGRVLTWFEGINQRSREYPLAALGHAYFWDVTDADTLQEAWEYQIQYHVERAFAFDSEVGRMVAAEWDRIFEPFQTPPSDGK